MSCYVFSNIITIVFVSSTSNAANATTANPLFHTTTSTTIFFPTITVSPAFSRKSTTERATAFTDTTTILTLAAFFLAAFTFAFAIIFTFSTDAYDSNHDGHWYIFRRDPRVLDARLWLHLGEAQAFALSYALAVSQCIFVFETVSIHPGAYTGRWSGARAATGLSHQHRDRATFASVAGQGRGTAAQSHEDSFAPSQSGRGRGRLGPRSHSRDYLQDTISIHMVDSRFAIPSLRVLVFGHMADAAKGIEHFMGVNEEEISKRMLKGLQAIHREFEGLLRSAKRLHPPDADVVRTAEVSFECMKYVLYGEAGSSKRTFPNSPHPRDCDARGLLPERRAPSGCGMRLQDFAGAPASQQAGLTMLQVAALRIYTTAAFRSINDPLRDAGHSKRKTPHPLPLTCSLIDRAVGKLRAVGAYGAHANEAMDLWRGLRDVTVPDEFLRRGGTELAPMSTTQDATCAVKYGMAGQHCVLLKLRTRSSMERGADLTFLSAFPREREFLFKPLTFLQVLGPPRSITLAGKPMTVIDVEPRV